MDYLIKMRQDLMPVLAEAIRAGIVKTEQEAAQFYAHLLKTCVKLEQGCNWEVFFTNPPEI